MFKPNSTAKSYIGLHFLAADILSSSSITIFVHIQTYQSSLDELILACLSVLLLAAPGFEGRGLQSTAIREGQGPGPVQGALVHGVQVDGGLLLALATRQEGNAFMREHKS